jgi:hypothetical protein
VIAVISVSFLKERRKTRRNAPHNFPQHHPLIRQKADQPYNPGAIWHLGGSMPGREGRMRVIIRFSVDGEANSALRNKLSGRLTRAGFVRAQNTATYENGNIDEGDAATLLASFWRCANNHAGPGRLDHFWLYSDRQ